MTQYSKEELRAMSPKEFRNIVRKGEWTGITRGACQGHPRANLVVVPKEYAFDFLLFCNRNPQSCYVCDITESGDPHFKLMAPEADLRTDLPKYRVFKDGELVDEPTDVVKYWRDDLVGFLIGSSSGIILGLEAANIPWRRYGAYRTTLPCVPAGRFHGPMVVTVRAFYNSHDAVRAIQISSRRLFFHGPPVHIGDPVAIGIVDLCKPDPFIPTRPVVEPPKPGEILLYWGCGVTPQTVAMESKIPFMITHSPTHEFVMDQLVAELDVI
jgi:uncharacterized protein YcsI (UPF0317 family)